ncbi:hypothetical protein ACWCYK_36135 [Streptomyces lydicamycinicus]|nr:hypothetical protein [Streptomyces lydicamycinicus]
MIAACFVVTGFRPANDVMIFVKTLQAVCTPVAKRPAELLSRAS